MPDSLGSTSSLGNGVMGARTHIVWRSTRRFYQVKYARGYPIVPVKLAGAVIGNHLKYLAVSAPRPSRPSEYELDAQPWASCRIVVPAPQFFRAASAAVHSQQVVRGGERRRDGQQHRGVCVAVSFRDPSRSDWRG